MSRTRGPMVCRTRLVLGLALLFSGCVAIAYEPTHRQEEGRTEQDPEGPDLPPKTQAEGSSPLQLSWTMDKQLIDQERTISGLRLGILASQNKRVHGLDLNLGIGNSWGGNGIALSLFGNAGYDFFNGIQAAGLVNWMHGHAFVSGIQVTALMNRCTYGDAAGIQLAGMANLHKNQYGLQIAILNGASNAHGIQAGLFNLVDRSGYGLQLGLANFGDDIHGVQMGLVNQNKSGLQFGLLNFNENGFLPVFPLFNF